MADRAYRGTRRLICTAELAPGSVISEASLVTSLGIGRTPVREALRALAAEHLIDIYPRHGMFVAGVDPRNLRALSEVRERLEPFAAGLAAQRRDDQDVVEIDARATALIEAIDYIELSDRANSMTSSSMSSPSLGPERRAPIAVIDCGALAVDLERTTRTLGQLRPHYAEIAIGYADCPGTTATTPTPERIGSPP